MTNFRMTFFEIPILDGELQSLHLKVGFAVTRLVDGRNFLHILAHNRSAVITLMFDPHITSKIAYIES